MGTADLNSTVVYCTRYSRFAVLENEDLDEARAKMAEVQLF